MSVLSRWRGAVAASVVLATSGSSRAAEETPPTATFAAPEPPAQPPTSAPAAPAPSAPFFRFGSLGSDARLTFSLLVQADAVVYRQTAQDEVNPSTGEPLNTERFVLRRAQPRVAVDTRYVSAAVMIDGNTIHGPVARVLEAEVVGRWPAASPESSAPMELPLIALGVGLMRIPFGFELPQLDKDRLFLERSNATRALFGTSFDLGARLFGGFRFLRYSFAAMNGAPIGTGAFEGQDPTKSKDLLFRLGVVVPLGGGAALEAGFSGLTGTGLHVGTPSTKDTLAWRDDNENGIVEATELRTIPGSAATASQTYSRFALGFDARARFQIAPLGQLVVQGEIVRASNLDRTFVPSDPIAAQRTLRQLGYSVGVTQDLTRYGAVGVRWDSYDPDSDASDPGPYHAIPAPRIFSTLALTGALRLPPGRLVVEYDVNRNPFGRDARGAPTTLHDDAFTLRAEVAF